MDHHQRKLLPATSPESAMASEVFDQFCSATTLKSILGQYRHLCEIINIRPNVITQFYPKMKSKLKSWKAQALWKKFDQRANQKCYNRGKACPNTRVLIIGGGPCGLRSAIEAQLLGARVVVVEKRDRMSRNNVLHLWPFVIQDLRGLGAKKFFGKFCAGSIDHISIRQLQCILLKVALILGVEFHENLTFDALVPPPPENENEGKIGWRAKTTPADHPVTQYEFDVLIGADGKRNTLDGFKRKEFRGKLAIAITANFINKRTEAEARVEEISGVAFIFNQKFFKELHQETGIDLENIVYYKDDTHYFVMTAKKHSLIDKGVIMHDHPDTAKLLNLENVDRVALMHYAREAAEFSTEYQMVNMEFAVNHYGQPDVAMFDFTSMYAAENASRVLERNGQKLFLVLVGDSLLEPFWPTGSGCARGFLSSLDAAWAIKAWGSGLMSPLQVVAERESIYRLLGQTTPENLNRDYNAYTIDPHTRYPNLNVRSVTPHQVQSLLNTDNPESLKQSLIPSELDIPKKRRRRDFKAESQVHPDMLLRWLQRQVVLYNSVNIENLGASFKNGLALCAIIHRYRPDLIDFHSLKPEDVEQNNQLAFDILDKELGIAPVMTGEEMAQCDVPDKLAMFSYLTQVHEAFRGEIPHMKHPKLEVENEEKPSYHKQLSQLTPEQKVQLLGRMTKQESTSRTRHSRSRHSNDNLLATGDKKADSLSRRSRKRRSTEKMGATVEERQQRLAEIEKNRAERMRRRQYLRKMATQQFYKSMQMLQANAKHEKDEPFEDYSLFVYRQTAPDFKDRVKYLEQKILYPDREPKLHSGHLKGNMDEEFSGRIKNIEDKLRGSTAVDKKPKDLLRAIGKIEKTDWNVKEIEKKIEENKMGRGVKHDKVERVPKWSREQFLARQIKMEKKGRDPNELDSKYADIDNTLKSIDRKIKEGNVLGHNKVSAMAEQFSIKNQDNEPKVQRSNSRTAIVLPVQGGSELCHFCNKRVYLMERLSAEGKFFHRGCFRCEYCSTSLRIGNHTFDREKSGGRFYCTQHFGLTGTMKGRAEKKRVPILNKENIPNSSTNLKTPDKAKISLEGVVGLDLLDRGQTPERIEFENLAAVSDAEEAHSQMDEDEWTDRNFGASTADVGSSDDISDMSDSDEDNEVYEEAMNQPLTTEGTLELAKNWTLRYSHGNANTGQSDTGSNEYEDSSDEYTSEDDESGTATEDEEDVRARERRKQEVWLEFYEGTRSSDTDTGSETEVASDDASSKDSEENSATEISTDSEFEHDGTTPTQREIPEITINDSYVRKTRGDYVEPRKVQVKSKVIPSINGNLKQDKNLNSLQSTKREFFKPSIEINSNLTNEEVHKGPSPLINPRKGDYLLNRTHSTEGIASKLSLELKKRYLLGNPALAGSVMKSGSTSNVDTKLRNLTDAISQHQKLLNPAPEPSPTMQAFLHGTNRLRSGNSQLSPISPTTIFSNSPLKTTTLVDTSPKQTSPLLKTVEQSDVDNEELPDVVKESSILESKTSPNIICSDTAVDAKTKIIDEKITANEPTDSITNNENVITYTVIDDDSAGRPRSPLHETSIVVPQLDWKKLKNERKESESSAESEIDSDSLSSSKEEEEAKVEKKNSVPVLTPPRLQIHSTNGDLLLDEAIEQYRDFEDANTFEPDSIECSALPSVTPEEPPMEVESMNNRVEHLDLHENNRKDISCSSPESIGQDNSEDNDVTTAALTETEFSEWARDGDVIATEDLRDVVYDVNPKFITNRRNKKRLEGLSLSLVRIAKEEDLTDVELETPRNEEIPFPNNSTSNLLANGENIDFMDTDNDSLLDDSLRESANSALLRNRGYIEFVNIKPTTSIPKVETNICAPIAKLDVEDEPSEEEKYNDENVIEINPITMDDVMNKLNGVSSKIENEDNEIPKVEAINKGLCTSMDEDSLVVLEPAEDTTTSEAITILASPINPPAFAETQDEQTCVLADNSNPDYLEYVKRLQSRIAEFSNAKDSIDVRKSKKKNSKNVSQLRTSGVIIEETKNQDPTSKKLEELTRERSKQKNLIEDLLMDKLEAHKQKSAEKKARRAARANSFTSGPSLSSLKPSPPVPETNQFVPASIPTIIAPNPVHKTFAEAKKTLGEEHPKQFEKSDFKTPVAPPRLKHDEAKRTAEKARQDARERARLKSDEELGLSPEDKIKELRMKVARRQLSLEEQQKCEEMTSAEPRVRPNSFILTRPNMRLQTSKSTDNVKNIARKLNYEPLPSVSTKSMDELTTEQTPVISPSSDSSAVVVKRDKKKVKDPERRKSIIQAVSDFFFKKDNSVSPTNQKDKPSMFRLYSKSKGKLDKISPNKFDRRPKSVCEGMLSGSLFTEIPPPIPPPPLNYAISNTHVSDDSLSEDDTKATALSSLMQKTSLMEESSNNIPYKSKTAKKIARQAQLKRLRMAQEIQRKLEETEVKQRDLESRGVSVEKALRGEGECSDREEADLLREWFDLMKERTELRRYEKELLVRAQEVQLEDRHERLQQELRERLADDDDKKTNDDVKKEGEILTEMLEIVAKRDSLIALLEEERQRYQDEDRDLEAQMLAKGLRLTPIKKSGPKYSV